MNFKDHAATNSPAESRATIARNSRYGLWLFGVYLLFYGAYVLITAFAPWLMRLEPVAGLNIAILSGFSLIAVAIVLALVYGWLCRGDAAGGNPSRGARP